MKKLFLFICTIALFGCSSPESVAEKALREIGNGKYRDLYAGINFNKLNMNKKLFTDAYITSRIGEEFCQFGDLGRYGNLEPSRQLDIFFQTDILFNDIKLVDKRMDIMDIYGFYKRDLGEYDDSIRDVMKDVYSSMENIYSREWDNFRSSVYGMGGIKYKNVKCYHLKYKVDNSRIASVLVIRLPDEGYRVGFVSIE